MINSKTFGTFSTIGKGKCYNKPFTISQYNHPFPNEHLHEKFAILGSWSSFHDYDAIYQYRYGQSINEFITDHYSMATNPIDFAMSPYIAFAFREKYIKESKNHVKVKITKGYIHEKMKEKSYSMNQFLKEYFYAGWNAIYEVEILDNENIIEPVIESNIKTNMSEKGLFINEQIKWNNTEEVGEAYYYVTTEKYITLTGYLGNSQMEKEHNLGDLISIKVKLNENLNETCTIGLLSLDDKPLEKSDKLLLTIVGKVRNPGQVWNKDRNTTYSNNWGNSSTLVQYIEMEAVLKFTDKDKPEVYSINNLGDLNKEFILQEKEKNWLLKSDKENPTLNYYIKRKVPKTNYVLIAIISGSILVIIIIIVLVYFCLRKKKQEPDVNSVDKNLLSGM